MSWVQPANDRKLIQTRTFEAPPETVFAAWTDPELLGRWWGPNGFTTTTHAFELRVGGRWQFTMHGPDGRDYQNEIEFQQVERPRRLGYRHLGQAGQEPVRFTVTVEFAALPGGRTLLTATSTFESAEDLGRIDATYGASEGLVEHLARLRQFVHAAGASALPQ